jgi:hypothetical protein
MLKVLVGTDFEIRQRARMFRCHGRQGLQGLQLPPALPEILDRRGHGKAPKKTPLPPSVNPEVQTLKFEK